MKLYEVAERYNHLVEALEFADESLIQAALETVGKEFEESAEDIAKMIKNSEAEAEAYKAEKSRLEGKQKAAENKSKRLKDYVKYCMETSGLEKVKGAVLSFRLQNNPPKMTIESEAAIPETFYHMERLLDTTSLKAAVKDGLVIPGVRIEQEKGLRIS